MDTAKYNINLQDIITKTILETIDIANIQNKFLHHGYSVDVRSDNYDTLEIVISRYRKIKDALVNDSYKNVLDEIDECIEFKNVLKETGIEYTDDKSVIIDGFDSIYNHKFTLKFIRNNMNDHEYVEYIMNILLKIIRLLNKNQ